MPTLIELAGARLPEGHRLDGRSLVAVLTGDKTTLRRARKRTLFWQFGTRAAVRREDWKLVVGQLPDVAVGLYDLRKDLGAQKHLGAADPQMVKQLQAALEAWPAGRLDSLMGINVEL